MVVGGGDVGPRIGEVVDVVDEVFAIGGKASASEGVPSAALLELVIPVCQAC